LGAIAPIDTGKPPIALICGNHCAIANNSRLVNPPGLPAAQPAPNTASIVPGQAIKQIGSWSGRFFLEAVGVSEPSPNDSDHDPPSGLELEEQGKREDRSHDSHKQAENIVRLDQTQLEPHDETHQQLTSFD
jgi:hypothetical protein